MSSPPVSPPAAATPASTRLVWWGLGCTIALDSLAQLLWKQLAIALPDGADLATLLMSAARLRNAWIMALVLLGQLLLWLAILRRTELSFAQPMTSLSYVSVSLLSVIWLGEPLHLRSVLSVGLILLGVLLISASPRPHVPAPADRETPP